MQLARAGDGDDPGLLGQEPGQGDLTGGGTLAVGDAREQVDDGLVVVECVRREAGVGAASCVLLLWSPVVVLVVGDLLAPLGLGSLAPRDQELPGFGAMVHAAAYAPQPDGRGALPVHLSTGTSPPSRPAVSWTP